MTSQCCGYGGVIIYLLNACVGVCVCVMQVESELHKDHVVSQWLVQQQHKKQVPECSSSIGFSEIGKHRVQSVFF